MSSRTTSAPASRLLSPKAIRQLDRLRLSGARELRGQAIGQRPSFRRQPAPDFREHRAYVPGDDIRYVDWRASARHEQFFVKQGEYPKEATVYLLVDCSASMNWGEPPKRQTQLQLAATLAYLALAHRDRLFVIPYGGRGSQPFGPISGKGQVPFLLKYLQELDYEGAGNLDRALKSLNRRATRGGLTFILSDLLDDDLLSALDVLPSPTWQVTVFHLLHPLEQKPDISGGLELVDVETGERVNYDITPDALRRYQRTIQDWQGHLDMACVEAKALYSFIPAGIEPESELIAHLRQIKVVQPL